MELEYRINLNKPGRVNTVPKKQVSDEDHPDWIIYQHTIEGTPIDVREDSEDIYHVHIPMGEAHIRVIMTPGSAYAVTSKNGSIIDIFRRYK
jgi:hypothetical protein